MDEIEKEENGGNVSATDKELKQMASELYAKLGGVGNKDARVVRALLERWQKCDKVCRNIHESALYDDSVSGVVIKSRSAWEALKELCTK